MERLARALLARRWQVLAAWALLGEQYGVATPTLRAVVEVASATVLSWAPSILAPCAGDANRHALTSREWCRAGQR